MAQLTVLSTLAVLVFVFSKQFHTSVLLPKENENLDSEFRKKIEKERIKVLISEQLGIEDTSNVTMLDFNSTTQLPDEVIRLVLQRNRVKPQKHVAQLLFPPTNRNFSCQIHEEKFCQRFEYSIPSAISYYNISELLYSVKRFPDTNHTILVSCYGGEGKVLENLVVQHMESNEEMISKNRKGSTMDNDERKWMTFNVSALNQLDFPKDDLTYSVEMTGSIVDDKKNLPMLKIIQDLEVHKRNRRSDNASETCRPIPFDVSFLEIGLNPVFSYPESFGAFFCKGKCWKSKNFYETIMDLVFQGNSTLQQLYGRCWATCCRPTEYENMDVILRSKLSNNTEVHNVTTLTNIIVKKCECR